jgi:two-component system, OmpR family, sensor histidine kinase PhoQ
MALPSLTRRLLLSLGLALVLFFGLTIVLLDLVFRDLAMRNLRELLDAQMVAIIGAAEPEARGPTAARAALESRLETPGSGLYSEIRDAAGESIWRSPSLVGTGLVFARLAEPGEKRFEIVAQHGVRLAIAARGITWEGVDGDIRRFTFSVASDMRSYDAQLWRFRQQLIGWFIGLAVLLLTTLAILMRWVLKPVRRLEREIEEVEAGKRDEFGEAWPRELAAVTGNLNTLLRGERTRIKRYRDTLGNLAHSLKTPLAVMRSTLSGSAGSATQREVLDAEIGKMTNMIEHQMQRAAASGGQLLGNAPVDVAAIAVELRSALLRVYGQKDLTIELAVDSMARFVGDRADLTEALGNVIDNACKWCDSRVRVAAQLRDGAPERRELEVVVDDDGRGIPEDARTRVLERGGRADETVPGHGLGLAMVHDTAQLYGGSLEVAESPLGGARITLRLPGRRGEVTSRT